MDQDLRPAGLGLSVEDEEVGFDPERFLVGDEDLGVEAAAADEGRPAGPDRLAAETAGEPLLRADRQALGVEHASPGQFEPDPVDPGNGRLVGRDDPAGKVDPDRRRVVPRQLQRVDPAVEGDDQVADLGPLGCGKGSDCDGASRGDGDEREDEPGVGRAASDKPPRCLERQYRYLRGVTHPMSSVQDQAPSARAPLPLRIPCLGRFCGTYLYFFEFRLCPASGAGGAKNSRASGALRRSLRKFRRFYSSQHSAICLFP